MSRIGKKPVVIPAGVTVEQKESTLTVKGPKGSLNFAIHPKVHVVVNGSEVTVNVGDQDDKKERALWGLSRALIQNLVDGVTKGFEKKLEVNGVGFKIDIKNADQARDAYTKSLNDAQKRAESLYAVNALAQMSGQILEMRLGFSHPIFLKIPDSLNVLIDKNVITISGFDKQLVGQFAAEVRELKKPEPYKGKGIKYADEVIRRKAGKVVKAVGGGK